MMQIVLVGLGAGAAAALLFASIASGSFIATFLFYLAPLPIMIAALGFSQWAGLIAALGAASVLGAMLGFRFFADFLVGAGLPAWWLSYLALLARPEPSGSIEWYPVGRLLLWAAVLGTLVVLIVIPGFGTDREGFQDSLRSILKRVLPPAEPAGGAGSLTPSETERLIDLLIAAIPVAAAMFATLLNVLNLWLAARIVRISDRLRRPWPDLAALALPVVVLLLFAGALIGSFLPDPAGILCAAFAASLFAIFALLGFAVLHVLTRGVGNRGLILGGVYVVTAILGWPAFAMSLLGLAETAFNIRGRLAHKGGPPSLRT
jgi:hypothetical protein